MPVSEKPSWPKTPEGVTDWEAAFEDSETGLIPLITQARSPAALKQSTIAVIEGPCTRRDDSAEIEKLKAGLFRDIPDDTAEENLPRIVAAVTGVLRQIKEQRIQKTAGPEKGKEPTEGDKGLRREDRKEAAVQAPADGAGPADKDQSPEKMFGDIFCDEISQRFAALQEGVAVDGSDERTLPFMLSADFAARFDRILRQRLMPDLVSRSRGILTQVSVQPADQRREFLLHHFDDRKGRAVLWESWQEAWTELTAIQKMPPKPSPAKKGGLLGALKSKVDDGPADAWESKAAKIRESNKRAKTVWREIREDVGTYLPPEDEDKSLLMELYGRSAEGISKQIRAILQIVEQGGNIGKTFDTFQTGKNVDLSLLAASYRSPELLLGEEAVLKKMLAGHKPQEFPLTFRYLHDNL